MIDAAHVAFSDLTYARGEMLRFLKTLQPGERVGLYILGGHGFQVALEPTQDHARLASTLAVWMPNAQDLAHAQDEERRNRQQFDWVHSVTDLAQVNGNGQGGNDPEMYTSGSGVAAAMAYPPDAELRPLGDRPEDFVLHLLVGVGRHLAGIPGHKTLVWISSDNVLADWSAQAVGREDTGNAFLEGPAMRARETLNEAHVSIYPLDVSQLEAGGIGADIGARNVLAMGKSDRDPATAAVGDAAPGSRNGRDTARMQEDTHPIQGTFRDLATATGGRALRRAGDIAHELDSIVADGRAAWLLSFTPDTAADGKYHVLTVKTDRPGVKLRFRTGYLYSKEPATMKDRFREAVWRAQDSNEIGLIALTAGEGTPAENRRAAKMSIAASDLALAQRGDRWMDRLDVFLVVRDDSGLHASVTGKQLGLALKPATYQQAIKDGIPMEESLPKVPQGDSIRLIVIDENSQRIGTITLGQGTPAVQ
jgi:VWFA-related protein